MFLYSFTVYNDCELLDDVFALLLCICMVTFLCAALGTQRANASPLPLQGDDGLPVPGCWNKVSVRAWHCVVSLESLTSSKKQTPPTMLFELTSDICAFAFSFCSDNNFGMADVIVHKIFIFSKNVFPVLVIHGGKIKIPKKMSQNVCTDCLIMIVFTYSIFIPMHYFNMTG